MFGRRRKTSGPIYATAEETRDLNAYAEELGAADEAEEAKARVAKWDRIVRSATGRGEDDAARDMAIRNRDRARQEVRDAEVRGLNAKRRRS